MTTPIRAWARVLGCVGVIVASNAARAQESIFYPAPAPGTVQVTRDVEFGTADTVRLRADIYRPAGVTGALPALIFFHVKFGADPRSPFITAWAQVAASQGLVALFPDIRDGTEAADLARLLRFLAERGPHLGIDRNAIALYAGSGNAYRALPIVEDSTLEGITAAVMYYGGSPSVRLYRRDLPILFVRAGLDRPGVNAGIDEIVSMALRQNAPVSVINNNTGYHAFEGRNDDGATRATIDATIDFVKRATSATYQAALRRGFAEASAAAHMATRNFAAAAALFADLTRQRPDDATLGLAYGEALLGSREYAAACAQFTRLRGQGLGARDLAIPAARACVLNGDAAGAISWLQSIPKRYFPREIESDSTFASLRSRPEFRALFQP